MIFWGPSFEFFFFWGPQLFLETPWQFSYLIFDFPFIPIFGTSFWSWKHRFGFDGVGSKRAYMRDTIQKVFPCCQPSRDLRSSRLESLKAKILSNSGKRTSFLEKGTGEIGAIMTAMLLSPKTAEREKNILNLWWTFSFTFTKPFFRRDLPSKCK